MSCPYCGTPTESTWNTCPHCSAPLSLTTIGTKVPTSNAPLPSGWPEEKGGFGNIFRIFGVVIILVTLEVGGLIYYAAEMQMEVVSENSSEIEAGSYQIIRVDDASRIEWSVTNHASEWPRSISPNLGFDWPTDIDAAFVHSNNKLYIFSGDQYHRVSYPYSGSEIDKVGEIGVDGWFNVPSDLDGALLHSNGKAYFFKGDKYYRYADEDVDKVGTIGVDGWEGIPSNIDGVLLTAAEHVHFFKGKEVWRYQDGQVSHHGKIGEQHWHGIPSNLDAVYGVNEDYIFFKDSKYYFYYQGSIGGAFAFDIFLLNEENCDNFVNNANFVYQTQGSKLSNTASTDSGRIDVSQGNYCVVFDNSGKGESSPPDWPNRTDVSLSWVVKAGN